MFLPASCVRTVADLVPSIEQSVRVFIVGDPPFSGIESTRRFASDGLPEHAAPADRGHYLHGSAPVLHFVVNREHRVEVCLASSWFGDGDYTAEDAKAVWLSVSEAIAARFAGAVMLSTPATTGRDCFARSLGDREFPVLSDELQQLIRATSGQGRIETFPAPAKGGRPTRFVEYDGRMMYAGCVAELGHGIPTIDGRDEFEPYARGRYRVQFTVPADWSHVGILGVHDESGGWWWPAEPGWSGTTWADGAELHVAAKAGWSFRVLQRIIFPEHRSRPLDSWANKLLTALDWCVAEADGPVRAAMARHAIRAMILGSIGAMHGTPHKVSKAGPYQSMPAGARDVVMGAGGHATWTESVGVAWPEMSHPEWSAAIWSRARARLLTCPTGTAGVTAGMLSVPASTVLGCRTDAVFLTADPQWPDDGKVGRLQRRQDRVGRYSWPTSNVGLMRLKDRT